MDKGRTAHPTALLISTTLAYYALDLVKDVYLYGRFGPGTLDPFYGSYALVEAAVRAFMLSALGAVLMPALADAAKEGGEELAERVGTTALLACGVLLTAVSVLGIVFAPRVLSMYGFAPTGAGETAARLVFAVLPLFATDKIVRILLEHRRRFGPSVAASLIVRVVFLAVVFAAPVAWGVVGAGAGSFVAAAVTAGFLLVAFRRAGARFRAPLAAGHALVRRAGALLVPVWLAALVSQWAVVDLLFASYFESGSLSLLRLSYAIYAVPPALFGISVATAVFPRLCEAAAAGDRTRLQGHLATGVRRALYFTLPAMFGLMVFAHPLIRVLYQRGRFDPQHTALVSNCLVVYAAGLMAAGMLPLLERALYAAQKHAWFIPVALLTLGLNVGLNYLFALRLGLGLWGLALSTTVASFVTVAVLWLLVKRAAGAEHLGGLARALVRMGGCAALMGAACHTLWEVTAPPADPGALLTGLRLAAVVVFGAALYFAGTWAVGLKEFDDCCELVGGWFGRGGERE